MKNMKIVSVFLSMTLGMTSFTAVPVITAAAETESTITTVENEAIYFSYPDSEKGYCACQIGEKIDLNLENYDLDNNDYEFGVSSIYFRIKDKSIARIDHVHGSTVTITGVSVGETVLKASTPDDQSISLKIVVEESTITTSKATKSTTPITTTTINRITDTQAIYDILTAYIEENSLDAAFADESKYPEFEGAVVIEFFDNSDKLNQLRDFAYLESNLSANYLKIIPVVNGVAITTRPTDPIEMTTTTTTIITEETVSTSKAIANVEITEVTDNTLLVKPVGNSAKLLRISDKYTLSLQQFKKDNIDIEPVVGMKLEITYNGTIATSYPASFSGVQKITVISDNIQNIIGDANCDGELSMADAVIIMQSLANPDKYGENGTAETHITEQGRKNADIAGENDGITNADALAIQKKLLKLE